MAALESGIKDVTNMMESAALKPQRAASPRDVSTPSRESTEDFIARYVEKLRAASKHDEDEDDEDAYVRGAPRECARA